VKKPSVMAAIIRMSSYGVKPGSGRQVSLEAEA
jgi:hypothetical protein